MHSCTSKKRPRFSAVCKGPGFKRNGSRLAKSNAIMSTSSEVHACNTVQFMYLCHSCVEVERPLMHVWPAEFWLVAIDALSGSASQCCEQVAELLHLLQHAL